MSAIKALKAACKAVPFKNFREINIGLYEILEFKFIHTKHGKKLVVRTEEFQCFLPERCSKTITTDKQIAELNSGEWVLKYAGRDPKMGNCILVDIIEKSDPEWEYHDHEDEHENEMP